MGEKRSHLGMAGHYAAMSEFLLRGYNVAVPAVDTGDDVFVVDDRQGALWRVQVKFLLRHWIPKFNRPQLRQAILRQPREQEHDLPTDATVDALVVVLGLVRNEHARRQMHSVTVLLPEALANSQIQCVGGSRAIGTPIHDQRFVRLGLDLRFHMPGFHEEKYAEVDAAWQYVPGPRFREDDPGVGTPRGDARPVGVDCG